MLQSLLKDFYRKYKAKINKSPRFQSLKKYLNKHNSLKINCHTVACGAAAGFFAAFLPIPIQVVIGILIAIWLNGNIVVAGLITTINNPITIAPITYLTYKLGAWILSEQTTADPTFNFNFDSFSALWHSILEWLPHFGAAYLIGLPILCFGSAILSYLLVVIIWQTYLFIKNFLHQ